MERLRQKNFFLQQGFTGISILALTVLLVSAVVLPFVTQLVGKRAVIRQRAEYLATPPATPPFIESVFVCYNNRTEKQTGTMTCWEGEYLINYRFYSFETASVDVCFSDTFSLGRNICHQRETFYANKGITSKEKQINATFCEDVTLALHQGTVEDPYEFADSRSTPQQYINHCSPGQITPTGDPCALPENCSRQVHVLGDASCDGIINIYDYELWRQEFLGLRPTRLANFNCGTGTPGGETVDIYDYEIWRENFMSSWR